MKLEKNDLILIKGGATSFTSGAFIGALSRAINSFLDLGRSLGTAIRRITGNNLC